MNVERSSTERTSQQAGDMSRTDTDDYAVIQAHAQALTSLAMHLRSAAVARRTALERELCVICLDRPRTHALLYCGHRCLCETCCAEILGTSDAGDDRDRGATARNARCPVCRARVRSALRIFT